MQLLKSSTNKYQNNLATFCKTGILPNTPGINKVNIHKYHQLVKGIFYDNLKSAFPLSHSLLSEKEWTSMVDQFRSLHNCQSPEIWKMPYEFYNYSIKHTDALPIKKYPFLKDLLLMEWLEIEVFMMEDEQTVDYYLKGDYTKQELVLNPELRVCSLSYPVHLKKAIDIKPVDKAQYFLSLHRHPKSGSVIFTDLSIAHTLLMELLQFHGSIMVKYEDMLKIFMRFAAKEEAEKALEIFITSALKSRLILGFFNPKYI